MVRAGLIGKMQAEGVVIEARNEISKGPAFLGMSHLAVRHSGWNHAKFVVIEAECLARKLEIGAALKLQEKLRPVMVVHPLKLFHVLDLVGHANPELIL